MRLKRVISGGQTGADQAAWRAAKASGIETGGWMPKGYRTEDGPMPRFKDEYGACEMEEMDYLKRTRRNVQCSDATLWLGTTTSLGYGATCRACEYLRKPFLVVRGGAIRPSDVVGWIIETKIEVLNVAGNRESVNPGIGERVELFLANVFHRLKKIEVAIDDLLRAP